MGTDAPTVAGFHDQATGSVQYVVADPATGTCAIIDPVLDFDEGSSTIATANADRLLDFIARERLTVGWILETHPHADHFSAAAYLKGRTGAPTAIGAHVVDVQRQWKAIYNWPDFPADGSQWDKLLADGEGFAIGTLPVTVMASPGHTPASVSFVIGDCVFVHDTLFMPDSGTARCDFPGGSAAQLWMSIQAVLALPDATRVFVGHDYCEGGREPRWQSTVAEQKAMNTHVSACRSQADFVALREARDAHLAMPRLLLQAMQVNINGGRLPDPETNGRRYLKIPLNWP